MSAQAVRVTATGAAADSDTRLYGWSIAENAGSPAVATVSIYRGAAATAANKIATIELAANGSDSEWFGPQGIYCRDGIFVEVVAGSVEVMVYYG